jgi:hypothetical protein
MSTHGKHSATALRIRVAAPALVASVELATCLAVPPPACAFGASTGVGAGETCDITELLLLMGSARPGLQNRATTDRSN